MRAPDVAQTVVFGPRFLAVGDILGHPLPYLNLADRLLLRGLALIARRKIIAVHGLQHVRTARLTRSSSRRTIARAGSLLVPAALVPAQGRPHRALPRRLEFSAHRASATSISSVRPRVSLLSSIKFKKPWASWAICSGSRATRSTQSDGNSSGKIPVRRPA
jgi:hypothetical protein